MRILQVLLLITACGGGADTDGETPTGTADAGPTLPIHSVTLNQAVELTLFSADGSQASTPVVAGRTGLVRVYVEPPEDWVDRKVQGTFSLDGGAELDKRIPVAVGGRDVHLPALHVFVLQLEHAAHLGAGADGALLPRVERLALERLAEA